MSVTKTVNGMGVEMFLRSAVGLPPTPSLPRDFLNEKCRFSSGRNISTACLKNEASYVRSEAPRGCQDSQPRQCQHADWSGIGLDLLGFTLWAIVFHVDIMQTKMNA